MAVPLKRRVRRLHYYIKEWREARSLTLKQLGERIETEEHPQGVAPNTIWRWENERRRIKPETLAALADALDLPSAEALLRPPSARESLDALLADAPDDVFQDVADIARRMMRRSGS